MDWLPVLLAAIGGGAIVTQVVRSEKRAVVARDEAWAQAAHRLRGDPTVSPATFFHPAQRTLHFEAEGSPALLRAFTRKSGKSSVDITRLEVGPLTPLGDVVMRVEPRGVVGIITKTLGGLGEVRVAKGAFEDAMRVTGHPVPLVRALLDERTQRSLLTLREPFDIDGRTLVIETEGHAVEAEPLLGMVRYAEAVVRRWNQLAGAPRTLARALGLEGDKPLAIDSGSHVVAQGLRRGRMVALVVRLERDAMKTVLSIDAGDGEAIELSFDGLDIDPADAEAALDAELDASTGAYR